MTIFSCRSLFAVGCMLLAIPSAFARDAVYLDLSRHGQKLNLGLAEFSTARGDVNESARARSMREVVRNDLLFPGIFDLIEGGAAPAQRKVAFESWQELKADLLVTAYLNAGASGRSEFVGTLHDVNSKQKVLEKKYAFESGQERQTAHEWADEIVKYFLGQSGIAHTKIYFVNDATGKKEVCVVDYDGQNFKRLTNDRSIALLPKVSPDGKWLAFTTYKDGSPHLYVMATDGKQRRPLCRYEGLNASGAWLPDGKSLVATLSMGREPNLYEVDLNGRVLRALTNSRSVDTAPTLSPDGLHMAFTSDRPGYPQIFTMDTSGANLKRFSRSGECDSPAWSPQGNYVVFAMSEFGGGFDIYAIEVASGNQIRLTFGPGNNENPAWSPDGRYIVFTSTRRGRPELWVMRFDGSNQQPVGNIPGRSFTPHWGP